MRSTGGALRFKLGLIVGLMIGFAIGARAGRERYDRLVGRLKSVVRSDRTQKVTDLGERSTRKARAAAGRGMVDLAGTLREKTAH